MRDALEEETFQARLRRMNAESENRIAEQQQFFAEQQKVGAELCKLQIEQQKRLMEWERNYGPYFPLAPIIAIGGLIVGGLGVACGYIQRLSCH